MKAGDRDPLLDAWDRARVDLVKSDANLWRCKELLLEWISLHQDPSPVDFEWLSRSDRLYLETRTVLLTLPDVVQIPQLVAADPEGEGEAPDGSAVATRTLADDVTDGHHDRPHP